MVAHWLGDMKLVYTSAQNPKPWTVSTIASPPFWRATAVIARSSSAALLLFIWHMAESVSSRVGGLDRIVRSWAAGKGTANGDWLLLLLSSERKYSLHSASRAVSLVGGVPFLLLTSTLVFLPLCRQLMDDSPCGGVGVCNLEVFHLLVHHSYFIWFVGLIQIGIEPSPSFSWLLWLGDEVPSLGFISLHLQLDSLVIHPTWQTTWLKVQCKPTNDFWVKFKIQTPIQGSKTR